MNLYDFLQHTCLTVFCCYEYGREDEYEYDAITRLSERDYESEDDVPEWDIL